MENLLQIKNVRNITVNDLSNNYKIEYIAKFQNAYKEDLLNLTKIDPYTKKKVRKTKEELCKDIGISETTLKRYMKDLGMKSFYRHEHTNNVRKKNIKKENKDIVVTTEKEKKPKKSKSKDKHDEYNYNEVFNKTIDGMENNK